MGAAATGNLLSDIAGIALGGTIQTYASYIGAEEPDLSKAQRETSAYRLSKMFGESFGISIGCLPDSRACKWNSLERPGLERCPRSTSWRLKFKAHNDLSQMLDRDGAAALHRGEAEHRAV
jgi:hypothetical protein